MYCVIVRLQDDTTLHWQETIQNGRTQQSEVRKTGHPKIAVIHEDLCKNRRIMGMTKACRHECM